MKQWTADRRAALVAMHNRIELDEVEDSGGTYTPRVFTWDDIRAWYEQEAK